MENSINRQARLLEQLARLYDGIENGKSDDEMAEFTERLVLSGSIGKNQMLTEVAH